MDNKRRFYEILATIESEEDADEIFRYKDDGGRTPIMKAVYAGNTEAAIEMLEKLSQDSRRLALIMRTNSNSTTIYIACAQKNWKFLDWFQRNVSEILNSNEVCDLLNAISNDPSLPPTIFESAQTNLDNTRGRKDQADHIRLCQDIINILNDLRDRYLVLNAS